VPFKNDSDNFVLALYARLREESGKGEDE